VIPPVRLQQGHSPCFAYVCLPRFVSSWLGCGQPTVAIGKGQCLQGIFKPSLCTDMQLVIHRCPRLRLAWFRAHDLLGISFQTGSTTGFPVLGLMICKGTAVSPRMIGMTQHWQRTVGPLRRLTLNKRTIVNLF
jgi:hypothetical protein